LVNTRKNISNIQTLNMRKMKRQITFLTIIITISLSAQGQTPLSTSSDTAHYTMGAYVAKWMQKNGMAITNFEMFKKGMTDVRDGKELAVADSTINQRVADYQTSIKTVKNRQLEEQLFADLKGQSGVGVLPNGVNYIIMQEGQGEMPRTSDSIIINAVGIFPDGTLFENTIQTGKPIQTTVEGLIPGLKSAVQFMREGSKWRIFIPSALGYGPAGFQNIIPPNMALIFEVTLEEVQ
jgi:FKBP-type peptidyl-prolyl cis-trans isomerase FklB